jgi:C-terminal processing protease CtpA/Prc
MTLSRSQRETMLGKIQKLVADKYFDPKFDEAVWNRIVDHHRGPILDANDNQAFERAVATMLAELPPGPLALLSERTLITPPNAINASFSIRTIDGQPHWVFKDVLPGGVASKAGIKAGDILLAIDGKPVRPSVSDGATPSFEMEHTFSIVIIRADQELTLTLETATPKYKDNPYSEPKALATISA